jgi:hypothetical protein
VKLHTQSQRVKLRFQAGKVEAKIVYKKGKLRPKVVAKRES